MTRRAVDLCEPEFLAMELHHVYQTFKTNGYPPRLVHAVMQQTLAKPHRQRTSTSSGPRILFPYYKGVSEKLQKLGRTLNFSVCYKRGPNLRSLLRGDKVNVPLNEHPGVVYEVKCSCSVAYIGETGFSLSRRFSQHISHLRRYIRAKQELGDAGHSTTTSRGKPSSVPVPLPWNARWQHQRSLNTPQDGPARYRDASCARSHTWPADV
ncbi:hypothetical protein M513_04626 [Trichuris suis]|uniref:Helix-turn-helix domain-containing protein n=1 Tax=Trichuris suis TaxID=68888 RepID=A0A085MB83_9BILA|nr:hypothetical protein M513_04626 [Trichuris suis]